MINQKKLRAKALSKIRRQQDIAKVIPMENGYFTRWLQGADVGEKKANEIRIALNKMK